MGGLCCSCSVMAIINFSAFDCYLHCDRCLLPGDSQHLKKFNCKSHVNSGWHSFTHIWVLGRWVRQSRKSFILGICAAKMSMKSFILGVVWSVHLKKAQQSGSLTHWSILGLNIVDSSPLGIQHQDHLPRVLC